MLINLTKRLGLLICSCCCYFCDSCAFGGERYQVCTKELKNNVSQNGKYRRTEKCMVIMGMEDRELFEGTLDLGSMLRANCSIVESTIDLKTMLLLLLLLK